MSCRKGAIHIGTSGWHYEHWKGPFYPKDMKTGKFLDYYKDRLAAAEINNSFYSLPSIKTFSAWRRTVPKRFVFAAKASRYITHMKKLKDPQEPVRAFFKRVEVLEDNLGPVLFQLPPNWKANPGRLDSFLDVLPGSHRYVFEFRDEHWFIDDVYRVLIRHNAAFCIYELAGRLSPKRVTADFVYVRLHGPGEAYQGSYSKRKLRSWEKRIRGWSEEGKTVYCFFDNDQNGYAALNAMILQDMTA